MIDKVNGALEDNILTIICFSKQHASRVAMEITPDLFSNKNYRRIAEEATAYIEKYNEPPGTHIRDLLEKELTHGETAGMLLKIIDAMETLEKSLKVEFVLDKLNEFVEISNLRNALNNAADLLHQGKLDEAKDALHVPAQTMQGSSGGWFKDTDEWLDFMDRNDSEILSSGIRTLDDRDVRPVKGEMLLFVAPPKSGKCIAGDQLVLLPSGLRKPIADVVRDRDPEVLAFNEKTGAFEIAPVAEYWKNGPRECVRLVTKSGRQIVTTEEHLYLTPWGWVPVETLIPKISQIAVPNFPIQTGNGCYFDLVKKIIPVGIHETYDLGIADHHNFVAADMIVHNSWFGIQVGKTNLIELGRKVLHISLENSLKVTKQRYTQAFLSMTRKQAQTIRVPTFRRDDLGGFVDIKFEQLSPRSLESSSKAELNKQLTKYRRRGQLYVQHFPDGSLTVPQLDRFFDTLEKTHNFVPDLVVLDFAEKMEIDVKNLRIATGRLFIALRGLAVRRHFALVTMSQGNRASITAKLVRGSQVAEDISKLGHADITLTFSRTAEEKEERLARVLVDGARNVEDSWITLITQAYDLGQFATDDVYFGKQAQSEVARLTGEEDD